MLISPRRLYSGNLLPILFMLTACGSEREAEGSRVDYDAMNRWALGPASPIRPEPIGVGELAGIGAYSCVVPGDRVDEVLFVATPSIGAMRLKGDNVRFSPSRSGEALPNEVADRFSGRTYSVELQVDPQTQTDAGPQRAYFLGTTTVRDQHERVVFEKYGRIECGPGAGPGAAG